MCCSVWLSVFFFVFFVAVLGISVELEFWNSQTSQMSTADKQSESNADTIKTTHITTESQENKEEYCLSAEDQKIITDLKESAKVHLDNEKYQEALECYHKIIEIGGDDFLVYSNMAYLYLKHLPDWSECEYYGFVIIFVFCLVCLIVGGLAYFI